METNQLTTGNFDMIKPRFIEIVDEVTFKKEVSFALQLLKKNSYLASATRESILESVLNVAQIGLTLNPAMKLSYLVPRRTGGNVVCCLEPSYQGLCKLVTDTGSVKSIYAHPVYENDQFNYELGTETKIQHKPSLSDRGDLKCFYAVGILNDGSKQIEIMTIDEINGIRDRSEGYKSFKEGKVKSAIWETDYSEMGRKTVLKRLTKYLPKTERWETVNSAIELDNLDYKIDNYQMDRIEELMKNSSMDEEKKEFHLRHLNQMSRSQANELIFKLEESQVDRITSGLNYNQSEILAHQEKLK